MDVSIIIVNYKTPQLCIDCIRSVFEKTEGIAYEIIVVDNQSEDGSLDKLRAEFGDKVKLIDAGGNLGFGRANNLGAKEAKGDYLFLLNSDTLLINNAIKILFDYISVRQDVGVVGGNLYKPDGSPMHSFMDEQINLKNLTIPNVFISLKKHLGSEKYRGEFNYSNVPLEIKGDIVGADMLVRASVFHKMNGFDEDFFMYREESELENRIYKAGYKIVSVPQAKITHLEGASMGKGFSGRRQKMIHDSTVLYFRKVYGEDVIPKVYKVLIKNCDKMAFRKLVFLKFHAVKEILGEKKRLKIQRKRLRAE